MNNNNKTTLLFDNISGEILEFDKSLEQEIVQEKHQEYQDQYIVFGRDYFEGHNVWFIKSILDDSLTRLSLEQKVLNYLSRR